MRSRKRTAGRRWLSGALLALLGFVLVGAPLAHAFVEAEAPRVATHAESEDAPPCAPGHSELFCHLCQLAQLQAAPGELSSDRMPPDPHAAGPVGSADGVHRSAAAFPLDARAPPVA